VHTLKTQVKELYNVTVSEMSLQFTSKQFILLLLFFYRWENPWWLKELQKKTAKIVWK